MIIPYKQCKHLIKEADVLLFKHSGKIGWLISTFSQSPYSHVGLAHWDHNNGGELYCVEFREFKGGRMHPMNKYAIENPEQIDVFRACDAVYIPSLLTNDNGELIVDSKELLFTSRTAHQITNKGLQLLGDKYSWHTIWNITKGFIPFIRLRSGYKSKDDAVTKVYVCSTLVTASYREFYIDPVQFLSDEYTKPGDLARSPVFHYLFTIGT